MNTSFVNRYRNYLRARTTTGGDDRLRGYPSNFFFGKDAVFYNLEFRSTSVEILKCALGAVAFYDAGDAAQGFDMLHAKQSVGFGVRALFPQVNRLVFRADLAFPLKRGPFPETGIPTAVDPVGFFFSFGQAFGP
jgi:hemolysin activation/secretion protein